MSHLRHEMLSDTADQVALILREANVAPELAEYAGHLVANHLAEHWGGINFVMPKDNTFKIITRDLQIFDEVNASNMQSVARKYNLSENAIYRIIKRIRARAIAEKQPGLF
jgi:Mor family transcriptional regulator